MDILEIAMGLIMNAGNARSLAMEALFAAKDGDFENAERLLKESDEALIEAHKIQTNLLVQEAQGEKLEIGVLLIHSQDHLMNAITVKDLAAEMIEIRKCIKN